MNRRYRRPQWSESLPPLQQRTLLQVLQQNASQRGEQTALTDVHTRLSHAQLLDRASEVAAGMSAAGIEPGEHVLLMLDNHVESVLAWLGLALCGAVEVPVNTALRGESLRHVVHDSDAPVAIVDEHYVDRFAGLPPRLIVRPAGDRGLRMFGSEERLAIAREPRDAFAVFYTSGTTGPSKGVLVPEAQAYGYATPAFMGAASAGDTSFVALPLFHVGGQLWGVYNALIAGGTAHVASVFSASRFWQDVAESRSTFALLTGAMVSFLNAQPEGPDERSSGLRRVCLAPVPADVDAFCERFGVTYSTGYGSTEASAPMVAPHGTSRGGSVGWLRPDFEAEVVDGMGQPVPDGSVGELLIRPTEPWTTFQGYWGRPEATVEAWQNLWFHTGDAVVRTAEGEHILVDRLKDSIRRRGENVSSMEVESAANACPGVQESAAIAVPSDHSEDEILLYLVLSPDAPAEPEDVFKRLAEDLPYFAVPRYIATIREFPRSASNKIMKGPLREAGLPAHAWDAHRHGLKATRRGIEPMTTNE